MKSNVRLIAFYLPQFHPIPENDVWWGKGFTEWTNVGKAKPLFRGHYQPHLPTELGYYDLRVPETRNAQAELAKEYGIEGFCYWHYWFGNGKRLLERPFNEVVNSKEPDFPFCLAWANETWKGFAHGLTNRNILIEQTYPGKLDYEEHFNALLPAFKDKRYIKVHNRLLFLVYRPFELPNAKEFMSFWQQLAQEHGLEGFYFVGQTNFVEERERVLNLGFDAVNVVRLNDYVRLEYPFLLRGMRWVNRKFRKIPYVFSYEKVMKFFTGKEAEELSCMPTIVPGWDHSPRSGREGLVYINTTPELFGKHVEQVFEHVKDKPIEDRIVFIKSWNEWAEGNYLEPERRYGRGFLEALKKAIEKLG